jgi:hypothetical protein
MHEGRVKRFRVRATWFSMGIGLVVLVGSSCVGASVPAAGGTAPPTSTQGQADAARGCQRYGSVGVAPNQRRAGADLEAAAAATRAAAQASAGYQPLADALSSLGSLPDATLSIRQRSVATADTQEISHVCSAIASPSAPSASPRASLADPLNWRTKYAWRYFVRHTSLTKRQIAGLEGNLLYESGGALNPRQVQFGCQLPPGPCGIGIAQWTDPGPRFSSLKALARSEGGHWYSLRLQLQFVWKELTGTYATAGRALRHCRWIYCATRVVERQYEIPADPAASFRARWSNGQEIYHAYRHLS